MDVDIPLMAGGHQLWKDQVDPVAAEQVLRCPSLNWEVPMRYHDRHFWVDIQAGETLHTEPEINDILFTRADLTKLHKKFGHVSATKLYNLLKRANEDVTNSDLETLKAIGKECFECQKFARSPMRCMASAPEDIQFNHEIVVGIMHINQNPVLQIVCAGARFTVAAFMSGVSAQTVWETLLRAWIKPYVGSPHMIKVDQGSQFVSDELYRASESVGIFLKEAPIESPSSMGIGERFHDPLRRIFFKLQEEHPLIHKDSLLQDSYKAMSDAMGPEGCVSTLLACGMLPKLPIGSSQASAPNQAERMRSMIAARGEMEAITAKLRLKQAMTHNAPMSLLDANVSPGMLALACRKKFKDLGRPI